MSEVELLRGYFVPSHRAVEWFAGQRPLPPHPKLNRTPQENDRAARFFFQTQVDAGMLTQAEASRLLARHHALNAQEAASQKQAATLPEGLAEYLLAQGWKPPSDARGDT